MTLELSWTSCSSGLKRGSSVKETFRKGRNIYRSGGKVPESWGLNLTGIEEKDDGVCYLNDLVRVTKEEVIHKSLNGERG